MRRWMKWVALVVVCGLCFVGGWIARGSRGRAVWEVTEERVCATEGDQDVVLRTMHKKELMATEVWCIVVKDRRSGREMAGATVEAVFQEHTPAPKFVELKDRVAVFAVGQKELRVGLPSVPGEEGRVFIGGPN